MPRGHKIAEYTTIAESHLATSPEAELPEIQAGGVPSGGTLNSPQQRRLQDHGNLWVAAPSGGPQQQRRSARLLARSMASAGLIRWRGFTMLWGPVSGSAFGVAAAKPAPLGRSVRPGYAPRPDAQPDRPELESFHSAGTYRAHRCRYRKKRG